MKKIFTLAAAVLASLSLTWAVDYYKPTAEEVVEVAVTGPAIATHAAIGNASETYTAESGKTCCDPSDVSKTKSQFALDLKDGNSKKTLVLNIAGCDSICLYCDRNDRGIKAVFTPSEGEPETIYGQIGLRYTGFKLDPNKSYSITFTGVDSDKKGADVRVAAVRLIPGETCTDPEFTVPADGNGFVGDPIALAITSKNNSKPVKYAVTVDGVEGVSGTDYSFSVSPGLVQATPLKAGTFEITFSQASDGTYCAAEKSATFVISEKTPVASVTIDGPTAGVIGQELTYTATAEGATAYQWLVDGIDANNNAATFVYTAAKGNHSIICKARNEFNAEDEWIASAPIALTVTKLCGELIKATHKAAKTADVTGIVGGTIDKNTQDGGKLGSNGHYFGIKLASGSFMAGDVVTCVATALSGGNTATLFSDKGTTSLGSAAFDTESLTATITLTESAEWIYLYRKESNCNPTMGSISVTRSCEASNDASIASLTINGEKVEENDGVFAYTVSAKENLAQVAVAYTIHPMATATPASGFNVDVPAAGDPANTQVITVTAEDGTTQKAYTVSVTKSASLSNDATLKALSVEGFELTPAFDPEVTAYTITKAYSAALPAVGLVTATTNDANATANAAYNELVANEILVQVLAEDGETANTYSITVLSAAAKKDLLEASFSNGANGYILGGNIRVPYLYGTAEPVFVAAKFWKADGEPTAEIVDGQLVVTGIDESVEKYTIEYVAVTPMEASYDLITFTEVPSYIFSIYGWDESKGIKFSKDVEEATKKRISEGQDRIYIALPAAESVILTGGSTGARPIKVTVNGVVDEKVKSTPKSGETVTIELSQSSANFVGIESNGNSGDAGFTKMQLVKGTATALGNTEAEVKAVKVVRDGQLLILKNGVLYNAQGAIVK